MSSPPLRVFLTQNQEESLFELSKSTKVPQRTRDRASVIRLSSLGWEVDKIAIYLKWSKSTLRTILRLSITVSGSLERLARVLLRIVFPSRIRAGG
jgi:hypothetical protein